MSAGACATVFTLAAAMAGVAGALLAQTTQFVGIDTLGFQRSAELLIILAFGGTGRLYGGLLGAAVFIVAQDVLAGINPVYWQFWLGAVLVVAGAGRAGRPHGRARSRCSDGIARRAGRWRMRAEDRAAAAQLRGFVAVDDVSLEIRAPARGTR